MGMDVCLCRGPSEQGHPGTRLIVAPRTGRGAAGTRFIVAPGAWQGRGQGQTSVALEPAGAQGQVNTKGYLCSS